MKIVQKRFLAVLLAVCMVFTMSPPITAAQASNKDSGGKIRLSGFAELADEVREQSVPIGTSSVELTLPDKLEAYSATADDENTEVSPPEITPPTEESTPPATEEPPAADTSDEDAEQPVQSDEPASKSEIIEENIVPLAASPSDAENNKPEPMPPSNDVTTPAAVTIEGVTWESAPLYDGETEGTYTFTAVLPSGYTMEDGVAMPIITVTVGEAEQLASALTMEVSGDTVTIDFTELYTANDADGLVAILGGTGNAVNESGTVRLLKNITFKDEIIVGSSGNKINQYVITINFKMTLDLNGYTLKMVPRNTGGDSSLIRVVSGGILTITDSSHGTGSIATENSASSPEKPFNCSCGVLTKGGTVIIEDGYFESDPYVPILDNSIGKFIINGGMFIGPGGDVDTVYGRPDSPIRILDTADLEVTGGTFISGNGTETVASAAALRAGLGNVRISGGKFIGGNGKRGGDALMYVGSGSAIITGGEFIGGDGATGGVAIFQNSGGGSNTHLTITGGVFRGGNGETAATNSSHALYRHFTGNIKVSGGTFYAGANGSSIASKTTMVSTFLADPISSCFKDSTGNDLNGEVTAITSSPVHIGPKNEITILDLDVDGCTLSPVYDKDVMEYSAATDKAEIGITATLSKPDIASMTIQSGDDVTSKELINATRYGQALKMGENIINIVTTTKNVEGGVSGSITYKLTITRTAPIGSPVTITPHKDGAAWTGSGKSYKLSSDGGSTFITDLSAVANGTYSVYESDSTDTGVDVTVNGAAASAIVDYYTVTFYDGATAYGISTPQAPQVVLKTNGRVTKPTADPTKSGFDFAGWKTTDGGGVAFDFTTTAIAAATGIYASWTAVAATAPTISSHPADTTVTVGSVSGSLSVTASAASGHTLSYQWYSNTTNTNSGGSSISGATGASFAIPAGLTKGTYHYYCVVTATRTDNGQTASTTSNAATVTARLGIAVTFNSNGGSAVSGFNGFSGGKVTRPGDPTKTGYTFAGWFKEAGLANGWSFDSDTLGDSAITLYAKWTAKTDTAYTVKHYQQNLADNNYPAVATDTENKTGTTDASVTPAVKSYSGFTAPATQTVTIAADGSTVVEYQYTRNSYTLTWNADGGSLTGGTAAGSVKFGASLTSPTATKQGYDFASWNPAIPATMPAAAASYTAQWTARTDTAYKIEYYQQNVSGSDYTKVSADTESKTGTTGATASVTPLTDKYTGFTYNAGATGNVLSGTIAADGTLVLKVCYDRNTYTVSFNSQGGSAVGSITGVRFGAKITAPTAPARTGYDFVGWYKESGCTNAWSFGGDTVSEAMTLYAKWTDTAAPAITAAAPTVPTSGWFNANTDITLTYSDNEGVAALAVSVDGAAYVPISGFAASSHTYTISTEGEHTYKFKATDAAGLSAETDAVTVKLDKTAPTGVSISYEAINTNGFAGFMRTITFDNFFKEKVKVTVTVTDATSGAAGGSLDYKAVNDATDETEPTEGWTTAVLDRNGQFSFEVNPDFRGLVWARGYDLAGNPSGWTSKDLTTEQTPPALALSGNAPSEDWQKTNITFIVTASDNSGIDSVTVSDTLSGSTPTVTDNGGGNYSITVSAIGTHGVTVTAADKAGNATSLPEYTIRIDKTAPTIADENVITGSTDGKLTFTVTPSDGTDASGMTGGSAKVEYSTDNSTWQTAANKGDGSYSFELTSASGDLYIMATDAVGNEGAAYHKTGVVLESTKPAVTFSNTNLTAAEGGWLTTAQSFTVTADDKPTGVTVSSGIASLTVDLLHYEGGKYVKDTSLSKAYTGLTGTSKTSDSISPADGRWKVIATAIDQNGNTTTETRFVRLDTGAPTLSGGIAANITDKTVELQFATTEAGDWYYLLDPENVPAKGEVAAGDKTGAAASGQNSIPLDSLTSGSKHTVYVVVKDVAGNISEVLKTEFATKQTAPTADKLEIGYVDETYTLKDGVELFSDPECTTKISGGSITGSIGDTVYIRYPEKTEGGTIIPASDATPVVISARPSAPAAPVIHYANETATMAENLVYSIEPGGTAAPAYDEASDGAAISINAQIAASGTTANTIYLRKPASEVAKQFASEGASKEIPARPATPAPGKTDETYPNAGNGKLTGLTAGTAYRVSSDDGTTWKDAVLTGTEILSLAAGSYMVQVKATDSSFMSEASSKVTIGTTAPTQETTPSAEIHYKDEALTGLTPGGKYEITVDGAAKEVTADGNGKVSIDTGWIGKTVDIVKTGNGTTTTDSPTQQLPVPARPAAPTPGKTDETYPKAADGTITQVDNGMEYRKSGDTEWKPITGTVVTGLVPGDYEVRIKATDSAFSGAPATVTIGTTAPQKAATPTAAFEAAGNILSNVADDMQYSLDGGATWKDIGAATSITVTDPINTISDILVKRLGNGTTTTDSDHQKIDLTKAAAPSADKTDETAKDARDGTLTQVSSAMEYQKSGDAKWTAITGTVVTGLAPGTYFVRVKGAGTVLASDPAGPLVIKAFGVVNIPVSGVAVIPTEKTIKAGNTAQLTAAVAPADATNKAVRWSSDTPSVATVDAAGLVTANATGTAKITATTVDGGKTAFCTVTVPETGAIDGTVTDKDGPVKGAAVTVHWGGTTGELVGGPVITGADGTFRFTELPRGTYSLVVKRTQGGKEQTITKKIEVAGVTANGDIFMPEGERNTVVEVNGKDTPSVAVEGLDSLFKPENQATEDTKGVTAADAAKVTAGGSVEIKLTAETKQNTEVSEDAKKIQSAAGDKKEIGLLLDLSVFKTVTASGGTAEPAVKLTELPERMEIVIPIPGELQGKEGLAVLRVHNGTAQILPTSSGSGEYYTVDGDNIILHVQRFSTYAVVNNKTGETPPPSGGGDDHGGGGGGGSSHDAYTITATAHEGGEISPSGSVKVDKYSDKTFTVTPDEGWILEKVLIDGKREAALTNGKYTFKSVTEPYTIDAYFVKSDIPVIPDAGDKTIPETGGTDGTAPGKVTAQDGEKAGGGTIPDTEKGTENTGEETADKSLKGDTDKNTPEKDAPVGTQPDDTDRANQTDSVDNAERPFILLSALFALAGPAFAVLTTVKKRSRKRKIISVAAAIGAVAVFLLTTGRSGFVLADWWTLAVAAFAFCAAMGVFVGYSKEEQPQTK